MLKVLLINILTFSILGVVVNMALPDGDFKKHVKFIVNITMLIIILKPFLSIENINMLEESIPKISQVTEKQKIEFESESIDRVQSQQIKSLFKKRLETQIETQLESVMECENVVAVVELENLMDDA